MPPCKDAIAYYACIQVQAKYGCAMAMRNKQYAGCAIAQDRTQPHPRDLSVVDFDQIRQGL
jgi:hypothetical protein